MPSVTLSTWQLATSSIAHKQDMLAYAAQHGVKVADPLLGYHTDSDLLLSWIGPGIGLGSLSKRHESRPSELITVGEFFEMCHQHKASTATGLLLST